jgi:hypothetical protein
MTSDYTLAYGTHATAEEGRCAMEWVSHLAGEPHSDQPRCVSPVLRALCIALNDGLPDEDRQRLRPFLTRTIGTADDGLDPARAWMALDWLIRDYSPRWLRLAGLDESAEAVSGLGTVVDEPGLHAALPVLTRARTAARNARGSGPWSPVRTAARDTAWSCAGAAAWAAARLAIGDMAGDSARAAARAAAADAAAAATQNLLSSRPTAGGRAAVKEATRTVLEPIVDELRSSAFELLGRMLPTERVPEMDAVEADLHEVFTGLHAVCMT